MTLPDIFEAVKHLSQDELTQLKRYIYQHEKGLPDLSAFEGLSDEALWAIVDDRPVEMIRLGKLRELRNERRLTADEEYEVEQLLEAYQQFILKRSKAMAVLHQRGIDVMTELSRRA
ncbi:MAG: hypothetical protein MUE54_15690 [Anaerolineae bacterium]|jgi:hypothetical protein|nr:hypothetical protein [Anaerolineae bacterium]